MFGAIACKHVVINRGGDCGRFHDSILRVTTSKVQWSRPLAFSESGEFKVDGVAKSVFKKCCAWCKNASVDTCKRKVRYGE